MNDILSRYKSEVSIELHHILQFWVKNATDDVNGGFIGEIDCKNEKKYDAPKGAVLNSRILWSFSAGYRITQDQVYFEYAKIAFQTLLISFIDPVYGGIFWTITPQGMPLDTTKRMYALAFAIYGASEYYKISNDAVAKDTAIDLYRSLVLYGFDKEFSGYREALSRAWGETSELRLSNKDLNEPKSMNTHLHILEAFGNLYEIWPDQELECQIRELIRIFSDHIVSSTNHHLLLFFANDWTCRSNNISYGHDIEAAWLLQEAAEKISDPLLINKTKTLAQKLATAAARGLDEDGGLWHEHDRERHQMTKEKHWWPQAEAMVGFFNAWQINENPEWLQKSIASWNFIQVHIKDYSAGEWHWGVFDDYSLMKEDKVGIWKCPYHNSRACMEIFSRLDRMGF